jgi:7-cyano-7-deazaguanine reductase
MNLSNSLLGKNTGYKDIYDPTLLFPIPRIGKRMELGLEENNLPFSGVDIWNAYEISWLNQKGKPCVAIGEFYIPANSRCIIESKSLKLYLNSFNNTKFTSMQEVEQKIASDLTAKTESKVRVKLLDVDIFFSFGKLPGVNI